MNLKRLSWLIVSLTPPVDFDGVSRPQGLYVDLGAFEFIFNKIFLPLTLK